MTGTQITVSGTLAAMHSLAFTLKSQFRSAGAVSLQQDYVCRQERMLGEHHHGFKSSYVAQQAYGRQLLVRDV